MKNVPDYNRIKIDVTFATSGTEYYDYTALRPGLLHSVVVIGHTWPVVAAGASGASGANVLFIDEDTHTIKTFSEILTGSTTLLSADVMVFPNATIRYQITTDGVSAICVSGAAVFASQFPTATVYLNFY